MRRLAGFGVVAIGLVAMAACSSTSTSSAPTTTSVPGLSVSTTTLPAFSGSASSKYCNVARQFSQAAAANVSIDPKTIFQEFDSLSGEYLAVVPAEIKADANTIVTAFQQLEVAFKAANYVITKVDPASLAPLQDPKFTAATARINAYDTQVCKLTTTST